MADDFDVLLSALQAIERIAQEQSAKGLNAPDGWNYTNPQLRGWAHDLGVGIGAARRHARTIGAPELLPLLDRLDESASAKLGQLQGPHFNADVVGRFEADVSAVRQATARL
jgi:hypothetical protein